MLRKMLLKLKKSSLLSLGMFMAFLLLPSTQVYAKKIDWNTGYFNLTAKTATTNGKISSLSCYQIAFRNSLLSQLELSLGYTLTLSKSFSLSGDMGYGPDMGLILFPFGSAAEMNIENKMGLNFNQYEVFRPFISGGFHQRQFQSIQASYAGFSAGAGFEYWWKHNFGFRALSQLILLRGPQKATAQEVDILGGITFEF